MSTIHTHASSTHQIPAARDERQRGGATSRATDTRQRDSESTYARAARQLRLGKGLVITGFTLLLCGTLAYCVFTLGFAPAPGAESQPGALPFQHAIILAGQFAMASGALLWLIGSFLYSLAALDSDPEGPDLYF